MMHHWDSCHREQEGALLLVGRLMLVFPFLETSQGCVGYKAEKRSSDNRIRVYIVVTIHDTIFSDARTSRTGPPKG